MKPRCDLANSAVGSGPLEAALLGANPCCRHPFPSLIWRASHAPFRPPEPQSREAAREAAMHGPPPPPRGRASSEGRRALAPAQPLSAALPRLAPSGKRMQNQATAANPKEQRSEEGIGASQRPASGATDANSQAAEGGARQGERAGSARGSVCILPETSSPALYL